MTAPDFDGLNDPDGWARYLHDAGYGQPTKSDEQGATLAKFLEWVHLMSWGMAPEPPRPVLVAMQLGMLRLHVDRPCRNVCGVLAPADERFYRHCNKCGYSISILDSADDQFIPEKVKP